MKNLKYTCSAILCAMVIAIYSNPLISEIKKFRCELTGSQKISTENIFGFYKESKKVSPLEIWVRKNSKNFKNVWKNTDIVQSRVWGEILDSKREPAIMEFSYDYQKAFIFLASKEEIENFIKAMENSTRRIQMNNILQITSQEVYFQEAALIRTKDHAKKLFREGASLKEVLSQLDINESLAKEIQLKAKASFN